MRKNGSITALRRSVPITCPVLRGPSNSVRSRPRERKAIFSNRKSSDVPGFTVQFHETFISGSVEAWSTRTSLIRYDVSR